MGCGCLFAIVAMLSPRIAFIIMWLVTDYVDQAFDSFIIPLLGLIFLPFTTLFYVLMYDPAGLSIWGWFLVIIGFILDLGAYGGSGYTSRGRSTSYSQV